jgi:hypothetical protein
MVARTSVAHSAVAAAFVIGLSSTFGPDSAQAQVVLDVAKITCDQYVHSKIATPNYIAAWLSGCYNGQRGNLTVDLQTLHTHVQKLEQYCYQQQNFSVPVMKAVEATIAGGK